MLEKTERRGLDPATAVEMYLNLLKGLNTIHFQKRIYLCDIKPPTIMMRTPGVVSQAASGDLQGELVRRLDEAAVAGG